MKAVIMCPYEIIGKLSLSLLGFRIVRVNGFDGFTDRFTATSREEAIEIASEMLASGRYESVVLQNLQEPEKGAIELKV